MDEIPHPKVPLAKSTRIKKKFNTFSWKNFDFFHFVCSKLLVTIRNLCHNDSVRIFFRSVFFMYKFFWLIFSPTLCFRPKFHTHFFSFRFHSSETENKNWAGIFTHAFFLWIIKIYEYDKCLPFIFFKINNKTIEKWNRDKRTKYCRSFFLIHSHFELCLFKSVACVLLIVTSFWFVKMSLRYESNTFPFFSQSIWFNGNIWKWNYLEKKPRKV